MTCELISQALDKGYSAVLADFRGKTAQEALDNLVKIKEMCQKTNAALEVEVKDPAFSQDEIIGFVGSILGDAAPDSFCVSLAQEDRERPSQQVFNLIKDISSATECFGEPGRGRKMAGRRYQEGHWTRGLEDQRRHPDQHGFHLWSPDLSR